MNKKPGFTDEVVVIQVNSEVVDGLRFGLTCGRSDLLPISLNRLYQVANLNLSCCHPSGKRHSAALDSEGMAQAWLEDFLLALAGKINL